MDRERLNQYAQPIVDLYNQIEYDLLGNIAKFIGQDRDMLDNDPEKWQMQMMQSLGMLEQENIKMLRSRYGFKSSQINKAIIQAGLEGVETNEAFFKDATKKGAKLLTPDPPDKDPTILTILEAFIAQAKKALNLTNSTLLEHAKEIYTNIVDRSTMEVSMGLKTGQQALRQTIRQWANEGIPALVRSDGAKLGPEGYVRTLMVTTTNNAVNAAQDERMKQHGVDLFEVTSHLGARPKCAPYQGTIISLSGNHPDYLSLAQTSFGQPDGLFGINCGHSKYPFIEGISEQRYFPYDTSKNEKAYKESQQQRYLERSIRKAKTQERMFRESGDEEAASKAKELVKARQKRIREFIKATDRRRRPDREQIVSGKEAPPAPMPKPRKPRKDPDPPKPDNEPDPTPVPKELPPLKQIQLDMIQRRNRMSKSALEAGDVEDMDKAQAAIEGLENGYFDEAPIIVGPGKNGNWDVFRTERDPETGRFKFQDDPNAPDDHSFLKSLNNHFEDDKDKDDDKPKPEPKADPEPKRDPEPEPKKEPPKPKPEQSNLTDAQKKKAKAINEQTLDDLRHLDDKDKAEEYRRKIESGEYDDNPLIVEYANGEYKAYETKTINGMFVARLDIDKDHEEYVDYDLAEDILKNADIGDKGDGLLVRLGTDSSATASYNGSYDSMIINPLFDKKDLENDITNFKKTFFHELGHRVHQVGEKGMGDLDRAKKIGLSGEINSNQWKEWKKTADNFWDSKLQKVHPDVERRMNYPVNAKHRYKNGTKQHFYMEMFAEASSYYLENDKEEMKKLEKHYPGLLNQMEAIYGLGNWKDSDKDQKNKTNNAPETKSQERKLRALKQQVEYRLDRIKDPKKKKEVEDLLASGDYENNPVYLHSDENTGEISVVKLEKINGMYVAHIPSGNPNEDADHAKQLIANMKAGDKTDGMLVRIMQPESGTAGYYQAAADTMTIPANFDKDPKYRKDDETEFTRLFYHELGHRVHQTDDKWMGMVQFTEEEGNLNHITEQQWKKWKRFVEVYWDPNHSDVPKELWGRMDYPINAKHHYDGGKKIHFQMEMFAESSSFYLENNREEMEKLERHYPGLLEQMEAIYGLGYWKDTSISDSKSKRDKDKAKPKPKRKTPEQKAMDNFKKELDKKQIQNILDASNRPFSANAHIMVELKKTVANMSKGKFIPKFEESDAYGYCSMSAFGNRTIISDYVLKSDDPRSIEYRIKTMFHEYYHAKMDGADYSGRRNTGDQWVGWEETFTESASHAMLREAGITKEIGFSYSRHLTRNLPKLKTLPEFQDCKTIEDFGRVAMKYRFGTDKEKTLDWSDFQKKLGSDHIEDWQDYVRDNYKEYAMKHKKELKEILQTLHPGASAAQLDASFNRGWMRLEDVQGPAFTESLAIIMNRIGVK
jgi:hypothetical protein